MPEPLEGPDSLEAFHDDESLPFGHHHDRRSFCPLAGGRQGAGFPSAVACLKGAVAKVQPLKLHLHLSVPSRFAQNMELPCHSGQHGA